MAKKKDSLSKAFAQAAKGVTKAVADNKSVDSKTRAKAQRDYRRADNIVRSNSGTKTRDDYINNSRLRRNNNTSSQSSSASNRAGATTTTRRTSDPRTTAPTTSRSNTTQNRNNTVQSRINPRGVETSTQKKQSWENKAGDIKESRGFKAAELGVKGALNSTKATFDAARNPNEDKYVKAKEYKEAQGINVDEKIKKYEGQYGQLLRSEQDKREWRETALEKDQEKADKINAEYQELKDKTKSKVGKFALDVVKTGSEMAVDAGTSLVTGTGPVGYFGSMASRVVGQSYLDAKSRGATDDEAAAYAFAEAGKEVGTEGMFAPAGKLGKTIFGGGYAGSVAGDLSDKVANKLTGNVNGKFLKDIVYGGTKTGFSMLEEGIEEMVSEGLDPMVANALYQKSVTQRNQQQFRNELDQKVKSGEVTQAQADAYYEQNKDKLDITTQFNLGDVAYSGLLGGALGMLGGGVNSLSQNMAGARATEIYGDEGIKKLAEGLVDIDETPGADVSSQAKAVAQMIKSGETVSNGQVAEMVQAAQQQQQRNDNNFSDSIGAAQKIINDNGHVNPVNMSIQPDENGNPQIVPTLSENTAKVYAQSIEDGKQAITNVLDENGISMSEEQIQSVGEAIADVQMGLALDSSTVEMFTLSHPAERAALETALGIKLPETNEGTRTELNKMIAENLVETAKTEDNTVRDQLKGLVHQTETTGYGRNGQMEFASRLGDEQINAMSGSQVMGYRDTFGEYYKAGMSGDHSLEYMNALNNPVFNAVPEGVRRAAYTAGMRDRMSAQNLLNGQLVEKGKSISKDIQKAKQKGSKASGTVTFEINNENRKSLGYARSKMWQSVANALGIDIVLADVENMQRLGNDDSIHSGINGFYNPKTGTIVINIDAARGLDYTLIHEVTHYIRLTAPEEYNKLASLVVDRWSRRGGMMNAIEQKKRTYSDLTDEQILEEIIADSTYEFLLDEGFVEEVAKSSPTLAQRLLEAIKYVAKRLRAMIADGNLPDLENEDLFSQLDILKEAETLWLDAYKKAVENSVAADGMARMSQSQLDNEYQKAYENGDTETAQRLVDEAAKRAGYDVEAWHGSMNDEFNTFDRTKIRSGSGFWFSENKGTAEGYSFGESNLRKYLLDLRNNKYIDAGNSNWATIPRDLDPSRAVGTILGGFEEENNRWEFEISFHDGHTENYSLDAQPDDVKALSKWAAATIPHMNNEGADKFAERLVEDGWVDEYDENLAGYYGYGSDGSLVTTDELSDEALTNGYDSLTIANVEDGGDYTEATNHIVNNPSQIKLADPFTFDDNGSLIPLSKRFDQTSDDIRYSQSVDEAISKYPDDPKMKNWHQETTEDATIIDRINEANIRYSVQPMNILVACEESQAVVKELRKLGHNAYSCDIQDQSGGHPEWHVMGDVSPMLNGNCDFTTTDGQQHNQNGKWDMIIAFPPCTHLALSGARWFEQKREDGRQREAIEFFASFFEADCDKLVVENPSNIIGGDYIQKHFPDLYEKYEGARTKPSQRIQPWMFGDNAQKTTCLWLKGVPELSPMETEAPDDLEFVEYTRANGKKVRLPKWYSNASGNRGKTRSKTFKGVAENMARQFAGDARPDIRYSIQGMDYTKPELIGMVEDHISNVLNDNYIDDVSIIGVDLHGSRLRGTARTDSDLDAVVEYEGDWSEDDLFNVLNETPLVVDGVTVDINPITKDDTGTLEDYMRRSRKYDERVRYSQNVDSEGNKLTLAQSNYFKNSVVRDESGNLKPMYHGTPSGTFTVFNAGSYFTEDPKYAERYKNASASSISSGKLATDPKTYQVYLNVTKPFSLDDKVARDIYINSYIKGGNAMGINPYLSDSEYDNIKSIDWAEGEDLMDFLQEEGYDYDAIVLNEGADGGYGEEVTQRGNSYLVFKPEQIKNVDNLNPTRNEDIRFSMQQPVEQSGDMIAWHNMSLEGLGASVEIGGLAMPSFAVKPADVPHLSYGAVSVIANKESVSPSGKNTRIFNGDAWTPDVSDLYIEYDLDSGKLYEISKTVDKLLDGSDFGYMGIDASNAGDKLNRLNGDIFAAYGRYNGMKYAYLKSIGKAVELPTKEDKLSRIIDNEGLKYIDEHLFEAVLGEFDRMFEGGTTYFKEHFDTEVDALREVANQYYQEKYSKLSDKFKNWEHFKKDDFGFAQYDNLLYALREYRKNGIRKVVDQRAAEEVLDQNIDEPKYKKWLEDLFDGVIKSKGIRNNADTFTPSGNRRSFKALHWDYSLANIVKALNKKDQQGKTNFLSGPSSVKGAALNDFKSIEDVRANLNRIVPDAKMEDTKATYEGFNKHVREVSGIINPRDTFNGANDIAEVLAKHKTEKSILNYLKKEFDPYYHYEDIEGLAKEIYSLIDEANKLPMEYFEAKLYRAYPFGEAAAIIVPDNIDDELYGKLLKENDNVVKYKAGDDTDRVEKLNSIDGIRFSQSIKEPKVANYSNLTTEDKAYIEAAENGELDVCKKMTDRAAKKAGYTTEGYHGTGYMFNVFDKSKFGSNYDGWSMLGNGFYFADSKKEAKVWGEQSGGTEHRVIEAYLKLDNPLNDFEALPDDLLDTIPDNWDVTAQRLAAKHLYTYIEYMNEDEFDTSEIFKRLGYDGIISGSQIVVFEPEQIKRSTEIVYDDNGNVVPLSQRFKQNDNDIRFSQSEDDFTNYLNNHEKYQPYKRYNELEKRMSDMAEQMADGTLQLSYEEFDAEMGKLLDEQDRLVAESGINRNYVEAATQRVVADIRDEYNAKPKPQVVPTTSEQPPLPEDVIYDYMADHPEEFEQMWTSVPEDSNYVQHRAETLESLKAQVQKLKQNQKKTEGKTLDETSVRTDFNDMVKAMLQASSEGRGTKKTDNKLVKQAVNNAKIMFNYFHSGDTENMTLTALSAAEDMVDGLKFINDDVYTYYKDLRDYLKTVPVKVDDTIKSDIPDYAEWKKTQWGRIRIANEGIPVDVMYGELCGMFPDMFDSAISNPTDMLLRMGEAMEEVQPYAVYLSSEERAALVSQVASDMIRITMLGKPYQSMVDRYEDKLKAAKQRATEAERDKSKYQRELWKANERTAKTDDKLLAQQMAAGREKAALNNQIDAERELRKEKVKAVREDRDAKIKKLQEKQKAKEQARKAARERAKSWKHLQDDYKWLASRLIKPNDQKHIPEEFRAALAGFLQNLDLQSERSKELELKYGKVSGATQNLINLRTRLGEIAKEDGTGSLEYDGYVFELMDAMLKKMEGPDEDVNALDELTDQTLREVSIILRSIKHGIDNVDKARTEGQKKKISELGESTIDSCNAHVRVHGKYKVRQNFLSVPDQILNESMVTPRDMFERVGGGLEDVFMGIRHGFDKHVDNMDQARTFFRELFADYGKKGRPGSEIEKWRGTKSVQEFTLVNGEKVSMSAAQIMSLYCSIKREQAAGHIYGGGIVMTEVRDNNLKTFLLGKPKEIQSGTTKITPLDAQSITSKLTPEQKAIADKLVAYLNGPCADQGNETSMAMYGYKKFTEPNYFPIKSSDQYLDSNFDAHDSVEKIRNFGFTKGTVVNANNPVVIDDIFSVVANHINQMSMYNAFAAPISDFTRVYNYRTADEDGINTVSAKEAVARAYGTGAQKYISNFIEDLQNQQKLRRDPLDTAVNRLLANYKKATIGFNIRVALQQPTAIVRSFAMISPKYFVNTNVNIKANLKDMKEHCQIARWKSWGFNQIDLANTLEDIMMNKEWSREDIMTMQIYGALDDVTWSAIWVAVKNETKAKHPEVAYESEEFYAICNERASAIFDKTQVVDSPLHRSQIMRKKDIMSKMLVSFMAEPTRTYNMMRSAYAEAYTLWKSGNHSEAAKIMLKYTNVYVANALACAAAAAIADALRGKNPDGDDDDKNKLELWIANTWNNFWDNVNVLNMIPLAKDIWGFKDGWGTSNMAFEGVADLMESIDKIQKEGLNGKNFGDLINAIGLVTGKPVKNIRRELKALFGVEVFASTGGSKSEDDTDEGLLDKLLGALPFGSSSEEGENTSNQSVTSRLLQSVGVTDGTKADNFLNKFGINLSDEEQAAKDKEKFLKSVGKMADDYTASERHATDSEFWKDVTKGYKGACESGDIAKIDMIREALAANGGNVEAYDEKVQSYLKSGLKKQIGVDGDPNTRDKITNYLKSEYGWSDSTISHEIISKTDTAKELQKALAAEDLDKSVDNLVMLYEAGLTDEDLEYLWEKRWTAVDAVTTGTFNWPASGRVSSGFGSRWGTLHAGMDIAMPVGTEVTAADGGEVVYVGRDSSRGKYVDIKHDNGMITRYQHLSWWDVEKGQKVAKGQYIAKSGNTGKSTGPHLHFAIYRSTSHSGCTHGTAVDPSKYLESTT